MSTTTGYRSFHPRSRFPANGTRAFVAAMLAGLGAMAATEVWIGESSGNWSNGARWLDGSAPPAGGDALQSLRFTNPGASALTATNDLAGTFALNELLFDHSAPGTLTVAGSPLRLTGAAPTIGILGTGSSTITAGLVLGPASGSVSIAGSGSGSLTISSTISESGAAQRLVIAGTPATANVQTITLSGTNSFKSGVLLQSGNLALGSNGALGTGPLTVQGGTLRLGSATIANAIALEANLLIQAAGTATLSGVIASTTAGTGLELRSAGGTLTLTGANTFTGPLTINTGAVVFAAAAGLGTDSSAIILNATGAGLTYTGAGALTLSRPLETRTGIARFETQGGNLTLAGEISGEGGIRFSSAGGRTVVLALAGKVSSDLLAIIRERPTVVAELLRAMRGLSAKRVSALSRQIRDGDW